MTNEDLKAFHNAIHTDLKIVPQDSCFVVEEKSKDSLIKEIKFTFKNQDDVVIIKQKENTHTINILEKFKTHRSCDFIIVMLDKNKEIRIYFCEIKSSCSNKNFKKACKQIESSELFLKYVIECYSYYTSNQCFKDLDIKSIARYYYIYPLSVSAKKNSDKKYGDKYNLVFRKLKFDNGIAKVSEKEIDGFFKDLD